MQNQTPTRTHRHRRPCTPAALAMALALPAVAAAQSYEYQQWYESAPARQFEDWKQTYDRDYTQAYDHVRFEQQDDGYDRARYQPGPVQPWDYEPGYEDDYAWGWHREESDNGWDYGYYYDYQTDVDWFNAWADQ